MSFELISVLVAMAAIGVALAGLILATNRGLRQDMARMEQRLDGRIDALESRFDEFQSQMDRQIAALRERMARLEGRMEHLEGRTEQVEGLLKGLQETIVRRAIAS